MSDTSPPAVHVRSYGPPSAPDRHDFAQLVLPLAGALEIEIEGRGARLDPLHGAVVAPGAWHAQDGMHDSPHANRNLIVDFDIATAAPSSAAERLLERPFRPLDPAARKLVEFMGILAGGGSDASGPSGAALAGWLPLLLDRLAQEAPRPRSRLAALLARIELDPGLPWSTETMARCAGLSVSRLHALFRAELDASPHAWLLALRLARVRDWLAHGDESIAALALRAGFGDQSALTRALRDATGMTPAAYRRDWRERHASRRTAQENPPKTQ